MTQPDHIGNDDRAYPVADGSAAASVATLVEAGLPLESGLRALSEEAPTRRLRHVLLRMSDELAAGEPADDVLSRGGTGLPRYVRSLVKAGVQTGQLGSFLEEFLLTIRRRRAARRGYWMALLYPLLLLPFTLLAASAMMSIIVPQFKEIFMDFGVELPSITVLLITISDFLSPPVLIGFISFVIFVIGTIWVMPLLYGAVAWTRIVQWLPLIGTPSRMRGMSEFCSFLGLLISGGIPLHEALEATAGILNDANLKAGTRQLATRIENGQRLQEAAGALSHFSAELKSLFHWEERGSTFGDMLRQAGRVFGARSQVQLGMVGLFFQPMLLLFVGVVLALIVIGMFMPLIKLLNDLS